MVFLEGKENIPTGEFNRNVDFYFRLGLVAKILIPVSFS